MSWFLRHADRHIFLFVVAETFLTPGVSLVSYLSHCCPFAPSHISTFGPCSLLVGIFYTKLVVLHVKLLDSFSGPLIVFDGRLSVFAILVIFNGTSELVSSIFGFWVADAYQDAVWSNTTSQLQ